MLWVNDRWQEIIFGGALLLALILPLPAGELLFRIHDRWQAHNDAGFDWASMRAAIMYPAVRGEMGRFRPYTSYQGIRINNLGFRGPDLDAQREAGTIRISYIGDSKLFGADLPADATIPERIQQRLEVAWPDCDFEYALIAGPAWSADHLSAIAEAEIRPLNSDVSLLLSLGPRSLLQAHDDLESATHEFARDRNWLERRFRLASLVFDLHHLDRETRRAAHIDRNALLPDSLLADIYKDEYTALVDALDTRDIIAVAHRNALRDGQSDETTRSLSQPMRGAVHALDAQDLIAIQSVMADTLAGLAAEHGWSFIDPIHELSMDLANFTDPGHLSAAGVEGFARIAMPAIEARLHDQGHACMRG